MKRTFNLTTDSPDSNNANLTPSKDKELSNRRILKAKAGVTEKGTPLGKGVVSDQGRMRKKERKRKYYEEMRNLNQDFAEWAKKKEEELITAIQNGTKEPDGLVEAAEMYINEASKIKSLYFPSTVDVLSFGTNEFGQIAQLKNIGDRKRPCLVNTLRNRGVTKVACGGLHNISVTELGQVDSWGCNDEGSLGVVGHDTVYAPIGVGGFVPSKYETAYDLIKPKYTWGDLRGSKGENYTDPKAKFSQKYEEKIVEVEAGDCQSLALSNTGRVYFFGSYKDKEGKAWRDIPPKDDPRIHPEEKKRGRCAPAGGQDWPIHVWQLGGEAQQISCGFSFNAAVVKRTINGQTKRECFTWGLGECGELARSVFSPIKKSPELLEKLSEDASPYESFHVDKVASDYLAPAPALFADGLSSRIVERVACGGYHILVVARDSEGGMQTLYSSGLNNYGQLGHGETKELKDRDRLTKVEFFSSKEITKIAAGEHHSLCVDASGTELYAFGRSDSGELGYVAEVPSPGSFESTPVKVYLEYGTNNTPKKNPSITQISCGGHHSLVQTTDNDVYSWGYADAGALGIGKVVDEDGEEVDCAGLPVKMDVAKGVNNLRKKEKLPPLKATVQMVAGGGQHSAIIASLQA